MAEPSPDWNATRAIPFSPRIRTSSANTVAKCGWRRDDRVPVHRRDESGGGERELGELTDREPQIGVLAAGDLDHPFGNVDADGLKSVVGKEPGHAAGPASCIEYTTAGRLGDSDEPGKELEVGGRLDLVRQCATNQGEVSICGRAIGDSRATHVVHRFTCVRRPYVGHRAQLALRRRRAGPADRRDARDLISGGCRRCVGRAARTRMISIEASGVRAAADLPDGIRHGVGHLLDCDVHATYPL